MTHGSLFSGIGGFDKAAEWMGWENKFHCEWNPFGQQVLKYYWPKAISYNDITTTDFSIWRGKISILSGGFPCQPFSTAGKRKGTVDARYLWPEMLRVIREVRPQWVVGENVYGLVNWDGGLVFDTVCLDLENEGFKVLPVVLPACGVNAPHQRYRIWFIAYRNDHGQPTSEIRQGMGQGNDSEQTRKDEAIKPQGYTIQGSGVTINPDNSGRSNGFGKVQEEDGEISQRNNHAESSNSGEWSLKDPNPNGWGSSLRKEASDIREFRNSGSGNHESISADHGEVVTDPQYEGLQGSEVFGGLRGGWTKSHQLSSGRILSAWEEFPTQSPLCSGNDGIPYKLDGITFSKWRNESIKGYGNAIVPQVVLQIFKTIEKFDQHLSTLRSFL